MLFGCGKPTDTYNLTGCISIETDPFLVRAIGEVESNWDSSAKNNKSSARGAYQFVNSTRKWLGYSIEDIHDPIISTQVASEYLKILLDDNNGDYKQAAAEYFAGEKGRRSRAAQRYANKVMKQYEKFSNDPEQIKNKKIWEKTGMTCIFPD